ncbi:hypothetical protein [Chryseobacterium sp. R2ACT005]|uniref:hypothetical protein n=1 Tax=Chryseobacterium sp. R2ACT005 TaxID=3416668 RepID=UPI003CF10D75
MKKIPLAVLLPLLILNCTHKKENTQQAKKENPNLKMSIPLEYLADYPAIKDSSKFITNLRQAFDLHIHKSPLQQESEKITTFRKVKINGSDQDYYFIEYDWKTGPTAGYPWKNQILLTSDGKLVKTLFAQRYEFIKIFPKQNPFLLATLVTGHGNGGHEIYKITADSLVNIYDGNVKTYDTNEDSKVYEPHELQLKIKDYNNDGFNDIAFTGKLVLIQRRTPDGFWYDNIIIDGRQIKYSINNPYKKIPVEYIFLYDQKTERFKAKGNYREKYK